MMQWKNRIYNFWLASIGFAILLGIFGCNLGTEVGNGNKSKDPDAQSGAQSDVNLPEPAVEEASDRMPDQQAAEWLPFILASCASPFSHSVALDLGLNGEKVLSLEVDQDNLRQVYHNGAIYAFQAIGTDKSDIRITHKNDEFNDSDFTCSSATTSTMEEGSQQTGIIITYQGTEASVSWISSDISSELVQLQELQVSIEDSPGEENGSSKIYVLKPLE